MRAKRLGRIRIDDGKLCNQGRGRRENAVGPYAFDDALTGSSITCDYPGLQTLMVERSDEPNTCASLFFPGCSLINYGLPLVQSVYDLLKSAGEVDGISLPLLRQDLAVRTRRTGTAPLVRGRAYRAGLCPRARVASLPRVQTACLRLGEPLLAMSVRRAWKSLRFRCCSRRWATASTPASREEMLNPRACLAPSRLVRRGGQPHRGMRGARVASLHAA